MNLTVIVDEEVLELNVPEALLEQASDFFAKMDADMDMGWQMSRDWVPAPDSLQRCQIAADKLLTALENKDHNLGRLMAGYILSRMPTAKSIEFDLTGEMQNHIIDSGNGAGVTASTVPGLQDSEPPSDTYQRAQKHVSDVFKKGKQYLFTVQDPDYGNWEESPAFGDKEHAERVRQMTIGKLARKLQAH